MKSSISLEREVDDSSSDSNPFNPDLSSDSENEVYERNTSAPDDRPQSFGSAPHLTPSTNGSSISISSDRNIRSTTIEPVRGITPDASRDSFQHEIRQPDPSPKLEPDVSAPSRKDRKPPPPPRSHHGRRVSSTGTIGESSQKRESRLKNRLSSSDSPNNETLGASHPGSESQAPAVDHSSTPVDSWNALPSTSTSQRRGSRTKRPPTPPLSRRHSQMHRSQSTQSKHSRLTMSSYDSESNDGSRPSSPGPSSNRSSVGKRISMPLSSGDFQSTTPLADVSLNTSSPTTSKPSSIKSGRRASSYGNSPGTTTGSTGAPPPPPRRRTRDSMIRSDGSVPLAAENQPPQPQPSNALDILADLTKLQKEVDDLRGHYENRKG